MFDEHGDCTCIAKMLTWSTGTIVYKAPEVFGKDRIMEDNFLTFGAGVWSFGITCAEVEWG